MARKFAAYFVVLLAASTSTHAVAQNPRDMINMFSVIMRAAVIDHARKDWSKVPLNEASCVEQRLQQRGNSIDTLVQNGIVPTDPRIADIRSGCRVSMASLPSPSIQWNGRALDAIIVKSIIQQKNRILGKYDDRCYMFGLVDDHEFMMQRDPFAVDCESGGSFLRTWKVGEKFESHWNVN
jgi:hypothetical protein